MKANSKPNDKEMRVNIREEISRRLDQLEKDISEDGILPSDLRKIKPAICVIRNFMVQLDVPRKVELPNDARERSYVDLISEIRQLVYSVNRGGNSDCIRRINSCLDQLAVILWRYSY